ncbi:hypothetical protein Tco_0379526 [Tanacetum coccineum]
MKSICYRHQQVLKWKRNWNGQDSFVQFSNPLGFTRIIIDYFMSKDQSISRRNKMFWHTARDDTMFTYMRYILRFSSGEKAPKLKYVRKKADLDTSPKQKTIQATKGTRLKSKAKVAKFVKKKQPPKKPKAKGLTVLSEVALTKGDGVDTQSKVPDELQEKSSGTDKGTDEDEDDENDSNDLSDEGDDDNDGDDDDTNDDDKQEGDDKNDDDEETDKEEEEDNIDDEEIMYDDEDDEVTKELYEDVNIKQVDQYAQALSSIPAIVDRYMDNKLGDAINKAIITHNLDYRQEALDEKNAYIELVDISMRALIKEEVNTQIPQILPRAVSDFANPMIEKNVTESVEVVVLTRSSSQPTSTYEAATSLSEFERTKILIDKMEKNKGVEMKTKIETPLLDQTEGRKEGNRVDAVSSRIQTKAATYELKWIEDLVPKLWSPVQLKYNQHAYFGTSHWGLKRQSFYGYASNLTSSKDVYSRRRMIAVTRLTFMKKYDYSHLEDIKVRRDDQKLYTFKEGDFKRLRLQDIEDMLLLLVQQKLTNLTIDERYDLNVALRMYTRCIVIQRRVEDLQLGYRQAALSKEVDAKSRKVRWWKGIQE